MQKFKKESQPYMGHWMVLPRKLSLATVCTIVMQFATCKNIHVYNESLVYIKGIPKWVINVVWSRDKIKFCNVQVTLQNFPANVGIFFFFYKKSALQSVSPHTRILTTLFTLVGMDLADCKHIQLL